MTNSPTLHNIRDNIGIAIDGGGIRGIIVAHAIIELEQLLGVERLIDSPKVKVFAGTSTGALISFGLAAGMRGQELLNLYQSLGDTVFSKAGTLRPFGQFIPLLSHIPFPVGLQRLIERLPFGIGDLLLYTLFPARYSFDPLRETLLGLIKERPSEYIPNANPTLRELGRHLEGNFGGQTVIITATEVSQRRTHFLKTNAGERFANMKVVDAVLASSAIPTYWEPIALPTDDEPPALVVDGGVGSFGNPAFVTAWEMCDDANPDENRHYDPKNTTIFSFGTGTLDRETYRRTNGDPKKWWALQWSQRALDIFYDSALREQSRSIVFAYEGIDLRRFQVKLPRNVSADGFNMVDTVLNDKGKEMRQLVRENRHALNEDPALRNDPEEIWDTMLKPFLPH